MAAKIGKGWSISNRSYVKVYRFDLLPPRLIRFLPGDERIGPVCPIVTIRLVGLEQSQKVGLCSNKKSLILCKNRLKYQKIGPTRTKGARQTFLDIFPNDESGETVPLPCGPVGPGEPGWSSLLSSLIYTLL